MDRRINILIRSFAVWLLIIGAETINGAIRELFVAPAVGERDAKLISFGSAILVITVITFLTVRYIHASYVAQLLGVGVFWAILTVVFEIVLSIGAAGKSWEDVFADFNPFHGGLMSFGVLFLVFVPCITYCILNKMHFSKIKVLDHD